MNARCLRALSVFAWAIALLFTSGLARAATIVACVGDSITAGGWPGKLGTLLGNNYTVNNYGVSGTTLLKNGDSPYWNTGQFTQSHTVGPNIVVIMLGTNDSKPQNWSHKAEYAPDYEALIDSYTALASKPRIFLNLPPPAGTNGFGISGTIIENEIIPLIRQVAMKKGVGVIDVFSAFGGHNFDPSLYGSANDQVHPNDKGAQKIADTVYAAIIAPEDAGVAVDAALEGGGRDAASPQDAASGSGGGAGSGAGGSGASGSGGSGGSAATAGSAGSSAMMGSGGAGGTAGTSSTSGAPASDDGGCGCRLAPPSGQRAAAWAATFLLAMATVRRRRGR